MRRATSDDAREDFLLAWVGRSAQARAPRRSTTFLARAMPAPHLRAVIRSPLASAPTTRAVAADGSEFHRAFDSRRDILNNMIPVYQKLPARIFHTGLSAMRRWAAERRRFGTRLQHRAP